MQHERHAIVESVLDTRGEATYGKLVDANQLLALCTGEDQLGLATGSKDALTNTPFFTEACSKVTADFVTIFKITVYSRTKD